MDSSRCIPDSTGFHFVHASHPEEFKNKATQHAIRNHVMAAVGRKRRKPPRVTTFSVEVPSGMTDVQSSPGLMVPFRGDQRGLAIWGQVPPPLPLDGIYPIDLNMRDRELVHFMRTEGDVRYRPFRYEWHAMALVDRSAFYLYLANAALFLNQTIGEGGVEYSDCVESANYFSTSLNQVTRRLGNIAGSTSEGLITTVLGLLCYDVSFLRKWDRRAIHMNGLETIVRLRGGFQGLNDNIMLFTHWFDVLGSSFFDTTPRFEIPIRIADHPPSHVAVSPSFHALLRRLVSYPDLADIVHALERVARLASYVNDNTDNRPFWQNSAAAAKLISPISHFLLSMPRLPTLPMDNIIPGALCRELLRLALLVTMAGLKQAFSLSADELPALQYRFATLILTQRNSYFPDLELWAVIAVASTRPGSRGAYAQAIRRLMEEMNINTAEEVTEVVKGIIWIDKVSGSDIAAIILNMDGD